MRARRKVQLPELDQSPNPLAVVGNNNPPEPVEPTPYEKAKKRIDDLYDEAKLWLDGAVVDSADLASGIKNLRDMVNDADKAADEARKAEAKVFDDGKKEVQARYNPLIGNTQTVVGKTVKIHAALNKALAPWLVSEEKRVKAEADEKRRIADEAAAKAQEALRASDPANLADREQAEELVTDAKALNREASRAENTTAKISGDFGRRAVSLRTVYTATLIPATETTPDGAMLALRHFCLTRAADVRDFLQGLANAHVRTGDHTADEIPGFKITPERTL